jgi:hypothetical protein
VDESSAPSQQAGLSGGLDAIIAEFGAVREASLSRDQLIANLDNFVIVLLSAALVGLSTIISRHWFVALPMIAIVFTAVGFTRRMQVRLRFELGDYELLLADRLQRLLTDMSGALDTPPAVSNLWRWQAYHQRRSKGVLSRGFRTLTAGGMEIVFVVASVGALALFFSLAPTNHLTAAEIALVALAIPYLAMLLLAIGLDLLKSISLKGKPGATSGRTARLLQSHRPK